MQGSDIQQILSPFFFFFFYLHKHGVKSLKKGLITGQISPLINVHFFISINGFETLRLI